MDKVTKVATVVGGRLAKLVMDARRNASGNTQLVEELKRYNRRLEVRAPGGAAACMACWSCLLLSLLGGGNMCAPVPRTGCACQRSARGCGSRHVECSSSMLSC